MNNTLHPRVLVVDDDEGILSALDRTLRNQFTLTLTKDPQEALNKLSQEKFEVIISDQKMPGMTGTELLFQASNLQPLACRIILTAFTEANILLQAINEARIFRYITKPWNNDELISVIHQGVEHHRLREENEKLIQELKNRNLALERKEQELKKLNENLEQLVSQRTSELQEANQKLSELAMTDPLTQVWNRRVFFEKFSEEIERSQRYRHPIAIAMIDVDHFKKFNDMEGHVCGDEALKKVARVIMSNLRKTDVLCRYGGEEFAIMMRETDVGVAQEICERLRVTIETTKFQGKVGSAYLTISVGLAGFPNDGKKATDLIDAADKALYEAKRSGRNVVKTKSSNESFFI